MMAECQQKAASERCSAPLRKARECAEESVSIFEKMLGATEDKEVKNFLLTIRI